MYKNSELWSLNKNWPLEGPALLIYSSAATLEQNSNFALDLADTSIIVYTRGKTAGLMLPSLLPMP